MPLTQEQIEHKFRQQESENVTIYDTLVAIRSQLDEHDARFTAIDGRFTAIDAKLDGHDARFTAIDTKLDEHDARFTAIDTKLDEVLRRLPRAQ